VAARGLDEAVRVVPLRKLHHRDPQALLEEDVEALARGLPSRVVLVEVDRPRPREAVEEPTVAGGERRPARGHRLLDPGLERTGHVQVPLHEYDPPLAADGLP